MPREQNNPMAGLLLQENLLTCPPYTWPPKCKKKYHGGFPVSTGEQRSQPIENVRWKWMEIDLRWAEAKCTIPGYMVGIFHPASFGMLLFRRHPECLINKFFFFLMRSATVAGVCAELLPHVRVTPPHRTAPHRPTATERHLGGRGDRCIVNSALSPKDCGNSDRSIMPTMASHSCIAHFVIRRRSKVDTSESDSSSSRHLKWK